MNILIFILSILGSCTNPVAEKDEEAKAWKKWLIDSTDSLFNNDRAKQMSLSDFL